MPSLLPKLPKIDLQLVIDNQQLPTQFPIEVWQKYVRSK